jgi:hypothetical protein
MVMTLKAHTDYVQAITKIANAMPLARTAQLYEFALFLQEHPLFGEETFEEIARDEALWDAQFAATTDRQWDALAAMAEKEIAAGETFPMFDERGNWIEQK